MKGLFNMFIKYLYKILNIDELICADHVQWIKWKKDYKKRHSIIYWLEWELPVLYNNIIYKINFIPYLLDRFIRKPHIIDTKLKPMYYDKDELILHGLFSLLVDFVEVECSHMYKICINLTDIDKQLIKNGKQQLLGVKYLQHIEDDISKSKEEIEAYNEQTADEKEVLKLYFWWTKRLNREDEGESTGLNSYYDKLIKKYDSLGEALNNLTPLERDELDKLSTRSSDLEIKHLNQDQEMLHRLIDIRNFLWT